MGSERGAKLQLIAAVLIFGTIGLFRRGIALPSGLIACARGLIGAAFLAVRAATLGRAPDRNVIRRNLARLILSGACIGFNWILLFEAYNYTSIAAATLAYYMAPVIVIAVSPLLLHERVTRGRVLCVLLALVGMVLVSGVADGEAATGEPIGIALGLGASVLYASVMLLNRTFKDVPVGDRTTVQLASAGLVLIPYVILAERTSIALPDLKSAILLAVVAIVHTGVAYTLYFGGVGGLPAQTTALYSYIDPMTAILLSSLLPGERLTPTGAVGAVLILGSTLLSEHMDRYLDRRGRRRGNGG